jgi:hypothetical protein
MLRTLVSSSARSISGLPDFRYVMAMGAVFSWIVITLDALSFCHRVLEIA